VNKCDAELYDGKIGFVSQYGKEVVQLAKPKQGERSLDIGCGTGDLTKVIADAGALP
jgi:ubiquinone/menaquinone biosynthesis C-methylase UbiE